eukprot:TRINITY_DN12732_c0_g1_i1.p1 TRINITY_DN12732_c0_g1~~TRINITY_DN12732_c0_g1_i1.p1  ORF type:complete len:384 (-),score=57.66 TRINITY_DN12732_c0_g1_i1:85-1236(-)
MGCASSTHLQSQFYEQYTIGKLLDQGNFGKVYLVQSRNPDPSTSSLRGMLSTFENGVVADGLPRKKLCVKILRASTSRGTVDREQARWAEAEARVWRRVGQHANCVELINTFVENNNWYMVMEKCEGSFKQEWTRVQQMLERESARVFREMVLGVAHLHQSGIVHRDVKVENFLLGGLHGTTVKLADFGFSRMMPADKLLKDKYGTAPYMSPEMIAGIGYDCKTDVWSLGCTIHVLLHELYPYNVGRANAAAMKTAILADEPKLDLSWVDASLSHIKHMLERERTCRFTAQQVLILPSLSQTSCPSRISLAKIRRNRRMQKRDLLADVLKGVEVQTTGEAGESEGCAVSKPCPESTISSVQHLCAGSTNADSLSSLTSFSISL